jgi:hypothetical protein
MGHPYPPQPLAASANSPWQTTGGILPDGRQMLAGWRPPTPMANGVPSATPGTLEQKQESTEANQVDSNNDRTQKLTNEIKDTNKDSSLSGAGVCEQKGTGIKLFGVFRYFL